MKIRFPFPFLSGNVWVLLPLVAGMVLMQGCSRETAVSSPQERTAFAGDPSKMPADVKSQMAKSQTGATPAVAGAPAPGP